MIRRRPLAAFALLFLAACTRSEEEPAGSQPAPSTKAPPSGAGAGGGTAAPSPPPRPVHVGTVRGVVRLAEGKELPMYAESEIGNIQGGGDCPPMRSTEAQTVALGEGRALTGLMVSATGDAETFFAQVPPHEPTDRRVFIDQCRLRPNLIVALRGDRLVIQNQTSQPFFPVVGRAPYADSLAFGATRIVELERAGVEAITCAVPASCGRADLVVVMNPVFAVTGEGGRFEMTNVPADQPVTIHAWHPLFKEARVETRVAEGQVEEVEIVIEPRDAPPRNPPAGSTSASSR